MSTTWFCYRWTLTHWSFATGARVTYHGHNWVGTVVQQRETFRDILGPVYEYLVQPPHTSCIWYDEPDLSATDETQKAHQR
jgi:hypothetical protein